MRSLFFFFLANILLVFADAMQAMPLFTIDNPPFERKNPQKNNFNEQLSHLIWYSSSKAASHQKNIVSKKASNKTNAFYKILTIFNGVDATINAQIPFPAQSVRKGTNSEAIQYAQSIYNVDFVIDVFPPKGIQFYGININGNNAKLTTHFNSDSLLIALKTYDQVWWLSTEEEAIDVLTNGKKISKKLKKTIADLSHKAIKKKNAIIGLRDKEVSKETINNYQRWAWKQYSSGVSLLNNPANLPIKTLDTATFCTVTLTKENFYSFNRHLNFYASFDYFTTLLKETEKQLAHYSYVVIPATQLSSAQIFSLNKLSASTKIILAWFAEATPPKNLSAAITQIHIPQLNGVTKAIIPQLIFGALGFTSIKNDISYAPASVATLPIGRLQFGPPSLAFLDAATLKKIDTLVENGIRQHAMPGSQILISKNGIVVYYQNFGTKTYEHSDAIKDHYLYDLASLTKVMATTQAIMFLVERGMLDLDLPIAHYLPEMWGTDKEFIPLREILAHQAGLYPYIPFWKQVLPKRDLANALTHKKSKDAFQIGQDTFIAPYLQDSLLSWSIHSKRLRKPNTEQPYGYKYSDIGFIILKTLVERIINQPLDAFLNQNLYAPLGMNHTAFNPLSKFYAHNIVPTEGNGKFRVGELTGYVNDQNAALIGGVSGHAGLFSNALDLAKLMQMHLQLGTYGGTTFLYPKTILNFTKRQYVGNRRGLGWDKPSRVANGPTTDLASQKTFGHTGFTGTAAWADPEHQLIFIFLSNRVYPDAGNFKLNQLNIRTRIQGLLYEAIDFNN